MSHHRKRPEAPLDQFFRSVYDSLAKKVLEASAHESGEDAPVEDARVAKDRRSTGARKAGKALGGTTASKESTDEPTVH